MKIRPILILITFVLSAFSSVQAVNKLIQIECSDISLILRKDDQSKIAIVYFGNKFTGAGALQEKHYQRNADSGGEYEPMMYPAYGGRNYLEPILKATHSDGSGTCEMILDTMFQTKISDGLTRTTLVLRDKVYAITVSVIFDAYWKENIITQQVKIKNNEKGNVTLERFYSSYLPVSASQYYLTHFNGTWANEMQSHETLLTPGTMVIESKKEVRATQSENPSFLLSLNREAQPDYGEVILGALAWSGNYKINFELDECNSLNILSGINPFASSYQLSPGEIFSTPQMVWTYSNSGYGQASRNMHDWARKYALRGGDQIGRVVLNSWEGAYFTFDEKIIKGMIDNAAEMGVETFVLDDGWFGNDFPRNSDAQGLGDWQVNQKKLPKGIDDLASYAVAKGLKFGIWIEPEMVNPKSNLARQKPEWVVKSPNRDIPTLRNQWLLDLTNPEVQNYVYTVFKNTIGLSSNISYVKWDANRHVESFGSSYLAADKQSQFWIDYVHGLYSVYERINKDFPNIEIQLCSSGGGRLEYGALPFHNEFWASDNTDPFTRLYIQFATSLIYPPKAMASHVSISPNHQTGNVSSIKFRFDVAMMGRLGLELQPKNLTDDELKFVKQSIVTYKQVRHIVHFGDWYPVHSPYSTDKYAATQYVTKDKNESLLFAFSLDFHGRTWMPNFTLQGLNTTKKYKITELNVFGKNTFWGNEMIFTGDYLMKVGVNPNILLRGESTVLYLQEVSK
ncbi:MAG: alpha-galactosidase [Bacteroidia bacterium]